MKRLNILISHTSVYKKAGWGRIFPLAVGLVKLGNNVTIITTSPKITLKIKKELIDGVSIVIFPELFPLKLSKLGYGIVSLIFKILFTTVNKFDIVHSDNGQRPSSGVPCRVNKRIHSSIYLAEWYDWYGKGSQLDSKPMIYKMLLGNYENRFEIFDKQFADGVVVLSETLRNRALVFKKFDKIRLIHGGADVNNIKFIEDNHIIKKLEGFNKNELIFGYISSKGINPQELLPLVNTILNKNLKEEVKILVFGEIIGDLSIFPRGTTDIIQFKGWIDYKRDYKKLQSVDIFFLLKENTLGNRAGWPNCIGDYLACGRSILIDPVGEMIEFVKKYPFAFIETSRNEDDIYKKILDIKNNLKKFNENNYQIRQLAEEKVSWTSKSKELFDFYKYLIEQKK